MRSSPSPTPKFRPPNLAAVQFELAKRQFKRFVRLMWPLVEPATPLGWNWHLDVVCDHMQAIFENRIKDLVINIPPRSLKSTIVSVMFPAWAWIHRPELRFLTASYDMKLATRDAVRSRRVMYSSIYQQMITVKGELAWRFSGDQNVKSRYENDRTGHRICVSPGSGVTGEGGDMILVDDPHNVIEAESEQDRESVLEWWNQAMSTRANSRGSHFLVVMQRLHHQDLSGQLLSAGGYDHLCLPTLFENEHPFASNTEIGFVDPRTEDGQLLHAARVGVDEVERAKLRLGTYGFVGQHQQRPAPRGGALYKTNWFRWYDTTPAFFDRIITSWDLSFRGRDERLGYRAEVANITDPSHVSGTVWGFIGARSYLLDEAIGQWDIVQTIDRMLALRSRWPKATAHLVENKANGPAVEAILRDKIPGLLLIEPQGSKVQRAIAVQPYIEAGNVFLPIEVLAPWIGDPKNPHPESWLGEVTSFPRAKRKDRVDSMSQALIHEQVSEHAAAMRRLVGLTSW
ncbi:MAG: hypothetical protein HY791_02980 [Deltaproteobacteria bacterium]|nr:hypothetical protein [Deltaproteobacteria bacterium]